MSVYIKGMEMPNRQILAVINQNGLVEVLAGNTLIAELEAFPVPPHGRLVDADAIRAEIDEKRPGRSYEDAWTLTVIDAAPTVIPANVETDHE